MSTASYDGFSSTVDLRLEVEGQSFDVGQVGDTFLFLSTASPIEFPADGQLIITVDGVIFPYFIRITNVDGRRVQFF